MHWRTKAAIFRLLSAVPFGASAHFLLQRHVTKEWPRRPEVLDQLIVAARRLLSHAPGASTFIEVGAGRDLAVAIALRILGAERVTCLDIARLARLDLVQHAAEFLAARLGTASPCLRSWREVEAFGIEYVAPAYLEQIQDRRFDCFCSVDTLEHVPPPQLESMLRHARTLLSQHGVAVHMVDYGDHYARGDRLSRFNFLTFDSHDWAAYQSRFQYVNRLRHSQMVTVFERAGLEVVDTEPTRCAAEPSIVAHLAKEFKEFPLEDLFTLRALIKARPRASDS